MTTTISVPPFLCRMISSPERSGASHTTNESPFSGGYQARPGRYGSTLHGKFIALIFEKPRSARGSPSTSASRVWWFVVFLATRRHPLSRRRESIADVARTSSAGCRHRRSRLPSACPRGNGGERQHPRDQRALRKFHPCQALADFFTWKKFAHWRGFKLAYVATEPTSAIL